MRNQIREEISNKLHELSDTTLLRIKSLIDADLIVKNANDGYIVPHKLYKHIDCLDVAFVPLSVGFTDDEVICTGHWVNVSNPDKYFLIEKEVIKIKSSDITNWKILEWK
jgi:hypothetical protein